MDYGRCQHGSFQCPPYCPVTFQLEWSVISSECYRASRVFGIVKRLVGEKEMIAQETKRTIYYVCLCGEMKRLDPLQS